MPHSHKQNFNLKNLSRFIAVSRPVFAGILTTLLISSCTVGPDYVRPPLPEVNKFVRQEDSSGTKPQPAAADFWHSFDDPMLVQLVDSALRHNHDLRIAYANYQRANALLREARFEQIPIPTASAEASNVYTSADQTLDGDRDYDTYHADIGVIWELDFFGRIRRSIEAQRAETEASAADFAAMQIAVISELTQTYFRLRGQQEQLRIVHENSENQARTLEMIGLRYEAGVGSSFDVDRGRALLETTQSRVPALEADIAVAIHRIAVLTGATPESMTAGLDATGEFKVMPAPDIAVDTPGDVLRRRPDVAAAERRLAAASARIGVATADLFPHFTLGGLIGTQSLDAGALFQHDSATRMLTLGVGGPFLNIGQVRARIAAADADMAGNLAAYERTVLAALEETGNALIRISRSEQELEYLREATQASIRAVKAARAHFDSGAIDVLDVLDAERNSLQVENDYTQSWTRHMQAQVSLYEALAGGWPNSVPGKEGLGSHKTD
ncbi:MAG: TolC family protein [Desulforhopalus sp.]